MESIRPDAQPLPRSQSLLRFWEYYRLLGTNRQSPALSDSGIIDCSVPFKSVATILMTASRHNFYAYILLSDKGTLYTGQVSDLHLAVHRHRTKESPGQHDPKRLVYYETFIDRRAAVDRASEMKTLTRKEKLKLISSANPGLSDLNAT